MTKLIAALALAVAIVVVNLFVVALMNAPRDDGAYVWVSGDASVAPGNPWRLWIGASDRRGAIPFRGEVNGVAAVVDDNGFVVVSLPRPLHVAVVGHAGKLPVRLAFDVAVVDADAGVFAVAAPTVSSTSVLPVGDGLPRARLGAADVAAGAVVDLQVEGRPVVEFLVGGRLVARQRGVSLPLRVPEDAHDGDLIVVSVSDAPVPSARARSLVAFVGSGGHSLDEVAALQPRRPVVGNIAPSFADQQHQQGQWQSARFSLWEQRFHVAEGALLLLMGLGVISRVRQTPWAAVGAFVVVAGVSLGLHVMLRLLA